MSNGSSPRDKSGCHAHVRMSARSERCPYVIPVTLALAQAWHPRTANSTESSGLHLTITPSHVVQDPTRPGPPLVAHDTQSHDPCCLATASTPSCLVLERGLGHPRASAYSISLCFTGFPTDFNLLSYEHYSYAYSAMMQTIRLERPEHPEIVRRCA